MHRNFSGVHNSISTLFNDNAIDFSELTQKDRDFFFFREGEIPIGNNFRKCFGYTRKCLGSFNIYNVGKIDQQRDNGDFPIRTCVVKIK